MTTIYAHRGASAELPENTLPAFRRALELGADAIETDVHLTRDGEIIAIHDADGRRVAGVERAVAEVTLREIRTWDAGYGFVDRTGARPFVGSGFRIATLDEMLAELPPIVVNVDLKAKNPALVERFIALVRQHGAESRVVGASFDAGTLKRLRAAGYRGETCLGRREFVTCWLLPKVLQFGRPPGNRAQVPTRARFVPIATPRTVAKLHAIGLCVDFWTVNDPDEARYLVRIGADGIMTDDPARVAPAARAAGG